MPGLHLAILEASRVDGLPLALGGAVPWLTSRGHASDVVREKAPVDVVNALADIHARLGGDASLLAMKRAGTPPTPDLIHTPSGCLIEVDEVQHFTSARLLTFDSYPPGSRLGFDIDEYRGLVAQWRSKGDRAYAHKVAVDFPRPGGRQAQRAYNDALRDLLAPTFTTHPVIRIPVPGRSLIGALGRLEAALALLT